MNFQNHTRRADPMTSSILERNNVHVIGNLSSNETLVFSHGYGSEQRAWRFLTPAFMEKYRLVLFDLTGCGGSDVTAYDKLNYASLDAYAEDLIRICDELNIRNARLIAHSVSSMIGTLVANQRPDLFTSMVFIGASPRYLFDEDYAGGFDLNTINSIFDAMVENYSTWVQGFSILAMNNPELPELAQEFSHSLSTMRPDISLNIAKIIFLSDMRSEIAKLKLPVLLLQAKDDPVVTEQVGNFLQQSIPNSEIVWLTAKGHFPHMSKPGEVIKAVSDFLVRN